MSIGQPVKVFESHTKDDAEFCDVFDRACARVGIDAFRSEYESIDPPGWQTIKDELSKSKALFLLLGKALAKAQSTHASEWEYTQNWISYEIGVASALGIDIWVVCDGVSCMNFPVPYFNNYIPYGIRIERNFRYIVRVLRKYSMGSIYKFKPEDKVTCPHSDCSMNFNLAATVEAEVKIPCPCCLRDILFPKGFHLKK